MLRIMISASGSGVDVMDLEPIAGMVPFDGAAPVPGQDVSSDPVGNGPRGAQVEQLSFLTDPDHFNDSVAEDLFEDLGADPGTGDNRNTGLTVGFCRHSGIDGDRHFDGYAFGVLFRVVETVLTDGSKSYRPPFCDGQSGV
jgi:hypothetical protein